MQTNGKVVVGGRFSTMNGQPRGYIARLETDGTLDASFNPNADFFVYAFAIQSDGKILVGGDFTSVGGLTRYSIARLNVDGSVDAAFGPLADYGIYAIAVQPDGKILVGGMFTGIGPQNRNRLARLDANGNVEATFNPGVTGSVYDGYVTSLLVQPDGKIVVGGNFTNVAGQSRTNLARLNSNGTLDAAFSPGTDADTYSQITAMTLQTDGGIIITGGFTNVSGQKRMHLARLNPDGSLDMSFNPGANPSVLSVAVQSDGKVLLGGRFSVNGQPPTSIVRLQSSLPVTNQLGIAGTNITWLRTGPGPEVWRTTFDYSTNAAVWTNAGSGTRISNGWQIAAQGIPTNAFIRARGFVANGGLDGWHTESFLSAPATNQPVVQIARSAGYPLITVSGEIGQQYAIEYASSLGPGAFWQPLTFMFQTNVQQSYLDVSANSAAQRFYRARLGQ